ncbi:hypothetical protein [Hyphomonas sp. UBA5107]|uniref:hypothetical protein n=1 Tax=Hyphomonas sp. UBA5107 TaxID=1946636 RepID=UPI0025C67493|nr:hypothetical protein [Hyphomonas sp. UBA5107]
MQHTSLFIIRGDSSPDSFDLKRLAGVPTLSIGIAIDRWDVANWRPTYLVCLDDHIVETEIDQIVRLVREDRIAEFFLSGRALELAPELARHTNIRYLEEFVEHRFKTLGKSLGLHFTENLEFQSCRPEIATAETLAVRYGASLEYKVIALLSLSDSVEAFEAIREDFQRNQVLVQIFDTGSDSTLTKAAVFPYQSLSRLLDESLLGAVVVPVTAGEQAQVLDNLWLWSQPAFAPFLGPAPSRRPDLVLVCNNAGAAACEPAVRKFIAETPSLERCFAKIRFVVLDLAGDADLYQRENRGRRTEHGFRAGPNNMFFAAMDAMRTHWGHSLYMETDCVPIRPDWLGQVDRHLRGAEPPWVTGSIYRGADALGPREKRHINGNAIYATADPDFQHFVDSVWRPRLGELVTDRPELPFDCLLEALYELADARRGDADVNWQTLRKVSHKFRYSALIPNITSESGTLHMLADQIQDLLETSPDSCIVHTRALAGFVASLRSSGSTPSMPELLAITREAADGLPPRPPASPKKGPAWSVSRVREGLARRLPPSIKRLVD